MKSLLLSSRTLLQCLFLSALPVMADDSIPDGPSGNPPDDVPGGEVSAADLASREEPVNQDVLDASIAEVQDRVQMSAPMAIETEAGIDPVVEAVNLGLIVDATLEQVEAALAAAAATSDPEDDLRALELKHRGSYRFFCDVPALDPETPTPPAGAAPGEVPVSGNNPEN